MDKATFWTTKSKRPEFHAVVFEHPAFDLPFRLVANQFAEVVLGGQVHRPAPMQIKPPDQDSAAQPKLTLSFPRQVVGRDFKRELARIVASGIRAPIHITYSVYLGDTDVPQVTWRLYASDTSGIAFGTETVQVTATDDNPMRRGVGVIYDPTIFTGLALP